MRAPKEVKEMAAPKRTITKRTITKKTIKRKANIKRKTTETVINLSLNLDGTGKAGISTGIPFFDHMLNLLARHGLMDLNIKAVGDLEVDFHHTVEDVGLSLGEALGKALGTKTGIRRYGRSDVPMMDSLATVVLDISGRPYFKFNKTKDSATVSKASRKPEIFDMGITREFMTALSNSAGIDLHITLAYGQDLHHSIEAIFKALGRALRVAIERDKRIKGVMSTKGKL